MEFSLDQFYKINRRILIWVILFGLMYLLRDFFGLIFLTFIFAFISAPFTKFLQGLGIMRRVSVAIVFGIFVLILVGVGMFIVPRVSNEARLLLSRMDQQKAYLEAMRAKLAGNYPELSLILSTNIRSLIPEEARIEVDKKVDLLMGQYNLTERDLLLTSLELAESETQENLAEIEGGDSDTTESLAMAGPQAESGQSETGTEREDLIRRINEFRDRESGLLLDTLINAQVARMQRLGFTEIFSRLYHLLTVALALLFSFLIMLDYTRLGRDVRSLRESKIRDFYEQTAQPVLRFAYVVGRAFQAQAMIAVCNTLLTLFGMILLGLNSLAMLTVIVFFCSFIPVLGVMISTVPIMLVALNSGGAFVALMVVVMVLIIHTIEAYILNPLIYGRHLKINPVLVLIILFVGHHLFGLWGMLLGVPVAHYFIHDVLGVRLWSEQRLTPKASATVIVERELPIPGAPLDEEGMLVRNPNTPDTASKPPVDSNPKEEPNCS